MDSWRTAGRACSGFARQRVCNGSGSKWCQEAFFLPFPASRSPESSLAPRSRRAGCPLGGTARTLLCASNRGFPGRAARFPKRAEPLSWGTVAVPLSGSADSEGRGFPGAGEEAACTEGRGAPFQGRAWGLKAPRVRGG